MTTKEYAKQYHRPKPVIPDLGKLDLEARITKPSRKPIATAKWHVATIEPKASPPVLDHVSLPTGEIVTLQELVDSYVTLQAKRSRDKARQAVHTKNPIANQSNTNTCT